MVTCFTRTIILLIVDGLKERGRGEREIEEGSGDPFFYSDSKHSVEFN